MDLVREIDDPNAAAKLLVQHALDRFSTDNLSCMIVRLENGGKRGGAHPQGDEGEKEGEGFRPTALDKTVEEEGEEGQKEPEGEEKGESKGAEGKVVEEDKAK